MKHLQLIKSNLSKILATAIFSGVLSVSAQTAQAATLKDINTCSPYAKEAVAALAAGNIIAGGSNGYFNPLETVTRGQMITMLVRALGYNTANIPSTPTFTDVPANHWAYKYVEAAYREGLITKGPKGVFGINDKCTREQMAAMFVRSLGLKDEQVRNNQELINVNNLADKSKVSKWAVDHVEFVMASGLMTGTGSSTFNASAPASRQQAAVVIYRYLNSREKTSVLVKELTSPVQYPELYEALKSNMSGYKGELASNVMLKMHNKPTNEDISINFNITGEVNNENAHLKSKMDFSGTNLPSSSMDYEVISISNKLFVKLPSDTKWTLIPAEDIASQGASVNSTDAEKIKLEQLMRSYRKLAVTNAGQVDLNGITATKYEITLDKEAFKSLFSALTAEGYFDQQGDMQEILKNQFSGKVEIYLDQQNRITMDKYDFTANMKYPDTNDDIDINAIIDTTYSNIGADIEIKAPATNEVSN